MSWLFKSLQSNDESSEPLESTPTGIKDDLSELGHTIGRQLREVASFLAPPLKLPPPSVASYSSLEPETQLSPAFLGIRNDLEEIGGRFSRGFWILSSNSNKAVAGVSKFASNFLQFQGKAQVEDREEYCENYGDDFDDQVVGITNGVIRFVSEVSLSPECWTNFPLRLYHDFRMSDIQRTHALSIQQLVPDFAALRLGLLDSMHEEDFWMIYFIMLVPRLNEHDSKLLSTLKIIEARDVLLKKFCFSSIAQTEESQSSVKSKVLKTCKDGNQFSECKNKEDENSCLGLDISDETNTEQRLNITEETKEKENPCKDIIEGKQGSDVSDDINSEHKSNNNDETKEKKTPRKDKIDMVEGKEVSNISGETKQVLDIFDGKNYEKQLVKSNTGATKYSNNTQRKLEFDYDISFSDDEDEEDDLFGWSSTRSSEIDWVPLSRSSVIQGWKQKADQSKEKDLEDDWFKL